MTKTIGKSPGAGSARPQDTYALLDNHVLVCSSHDNTIRWQPGERLEHLFEALATSLPADHLALSTQTQDVSFQALDARGNQLAHYLIAQGVQPGDRVGLVMDKSIHAYTALLGVLKAGAAYVPMDASFPPDRISYILQDSEAKLLLTVSTYEARLQEVSARCISLDQHEDALQKQKKARPVLPEEALDDLAYIIYTSGSTGHPKGVAIDHPSICNFVRVAAEVYGIRSDDRIYQGMTLAFDFSVEEIWVPWMAGATLVPGSSDGNLVGQELADFIKRREITALCCVPTLLATIDEDIPTLRFLLVSGEACPQDLVRRWWREDRIMLNAYGPTEATVTATLTELYPDKPVTIGGPLPTYYAMILPEDKAETLPRGETGELCVAGIALARGYVNREEQTKRAFIPDFLELEDNPSKRIYRTGDLARINEDNEIEYLGRIDTQVKIRGYRIELTEIESVFMQVPGIAQAVVHTYEPEEGVKELVGYYTLREDAQNPPQHEEIIEALRRDLPAYMVPAYLEKMDSIPMLPSHKADRKKLPPPAGPRVMRKKTDHVAPEGKTEEALATALADVMKMKTEDVSATDDFFKDLGAHSLLMARFSAKVRELLPDVDIAMRDIYLNPNIRDLAAHLDAQTQTATPRMPRDPYYVASNAEFYLCGALQLLSFVIFFIPLLILGIAIFDWLIAATGYFDLFSRTFFTATGLFVFSMALPVAAKKLLIGTWTPRKIPIWSLQYFRFWLVKSLIRNNPMVLFRRTPLFNFYLRLLGADIGRNVAFFGSSVPIGTDLLSIGDDTIIQKDASISGYRAENGYIYIGPVSIGKNVYIGERSLLDIHTSIGDDAQLGKVSTLQPYQSVPPGKRYHGTPASETDTNYRRLEPMRCSDLRKTIYVSIQLFSIFLLGAVPALFAMALVPQFFGPNNSLMTLCAQLGTVRSLFHWDTILLSIPLYVLGLVFALANILLIPRLLALFLTPDKTYVLYGFHYFIYRTMHVLSNNKFFNATFGDSSLKPYFIKALGWDLGKFKQTGTNFGLHEAHDHPLLCKVGVGTMISDGLHIYNADFTTSSFKLSQATIGDDCFMGNDLAFPADARTGNNCLFATKVMVPIDGPIRENVGLLGSPCFEIPRSTFVDPDFTLEDLEQQRVERLPLKNKSNLFTMFSFLFFGWLMLVKGLVLSYVSLMAYAAFDILAFIGVATFSVFYFFAFLTFKEWFALGFKKLQPRTCTVYEPEFWSVEHYWKLGATPSFGLLTGTPFRPMVFRLLGCKIGKRVFDDGLNASERTLLEIDDYTIINEQVFLQAHSLEDGFFKSDRIKVGKYVTITPGGFIHYGSKLQDHAIIESNVFLMKGEVAEPYTVWEGNPARPTHIYTPRDESPSAAPNAPA